MADLRNADPTYAGSPQAPGVAAMRDTSLTTSTEYLDLADTGAGGDPKYAGRFITVVAKTSDLWVAMVPDSSTALDVADTTGLEPNVPKLIKEGTQDTWVVSSGRMVLAYRTVSAASGEIEVHLQ